MTIKHPRAAGIMPRFWGASKGNTDPIMKNKQLVNIFGAALVTVGVFSPLVVVPFLGAITFAAQRQGEGFLLLGAALVSVIFALAAKVYWPSVIAGLIVVVDVVCTLANMLSLMGAMQSNSNPFVKAFSGGLSPSWGFALLFIGAFMLIASAFLKDEEEQTIPSWDRTATYGQQPIVKNGVLEERTQERSTALQDFQTSFKDEPTDKILK
jgi:hypothetical protein